MALTRITGSKYLVDGSVTQVKLATDSVSTVKIVDLNVTEAKLADSAVSTIKIADAAVTPAKIDATGDYTFNSALIGANGETSIGSDGTIVTKGGNFIAQNTAGTIDVLTVNSATETVSTSGDLVVGGNLTVQGTTTSVNSNTLDVADVNITIAQGGTQATADGAGLTVDITDGTSGSLIYRASSATKWAGGDLGAEIDLVGVTGVQTLSDKTYNLVGAPIQGQTDLEAALRELDSVVGGSAQTFYGDTTSTEVSSDGLTITISGSTDIKAVYASGIRLSEGAANDYTATADTITLAEPLLGNIVVDYLA